MTGLEGAVALVTGAGGGIGRAVSRALVGAGADAWLVCRTAASIDETALACAPGNVRTRAIDLTAPDGTAGLADELEREAGRLDVLVHCAGVIAHGRLEAADAASLDEQYAANVRAFYVLAAQMLPLLRRGPGQIVVVNSSVVSGTRAGVAQFAATHHALRAITDTLRHEVNEDGIRVLSVFPGRTATSRQERLYRSEGRTYRPELLLQPEDVATMIVASLTLTRTAEVTDIHIRPLLKSY